MSAADDAYERARAEIARLKAAGWTELDFGSELFHALDRIPSEIAALEGLEWLSLRKTQIRDLTPLRGLSGLQMLSLDRTPVSDIAPLEGLSGLQRLDLKQTQVSDIAPLQGLSGLQVLHLDQTRVSDIAPLQGLSGLGSLSLNQTQISDISPLWGLIGLKGLYLARTPVSDIAPLRGLSGLGSLSLNQTQVSDIAPLRGLSGLQTLFLDHTQVSDLRPVLTLPALRKAAEEKELPSGLYFRGSDAAERDPELRALSEIADDHERTLKTLDHLATLPEWPAPLAVQLSDPDGSDPPAGSSDPDVPPSVPAPLQVIEVDGALRPAMPGDRLDADGHLLAIQGWEALRDYLADLADQRARIDNRMPLLGKAIQRLETALGEIYDAMNPVAVGTQGNRVIRLARTAPDMLMDEDADDIAEFAAALALFLERFPDWRAYRDAAHSHPPDPDALKSALPEIETFAEVLEDYSVISPEISDSLEDQAKAVKEDPEDEIVATGVLSSTRNVLSALGQAALSAWRVVKREGADIGKQTWGLTKKGIAGAAATGLSGLSTAALDIYFNNAQLLHSLAAKFPEHLDWLAKLLRAFGL